MTMPATRRKPSKNHKPQVRDRSNKSATRKPGVLFGVEIGGTKIQVVAGDQNRKILARHRFTVDPSRGAAGILAQIKSGFDALLQKFRPLGAGIGFGGPVDWRTGVTCRSHQVDGWTDFALGDWARKLLGAPVTVDNDANIAALGEAICGAGADLNPVFYATLGSGVGGGLVVNQAIYHGAKPGETEIGHVLLDRDGTTVEDRCSGWAVDKTIRTLCRGHPKSILGRLIGDAEGGEAKHLKAALEQRDPLAAQILSRLGEDLGFGLSHVAHLFHPEVIILGGGLSLLGEPLRSVVALNVARFTMEAFRPGPEVRIAELGEDVVPIGCLLAAARIVK